MTRRKSGIASKVYIAIVFLLMYSPIFVMIFYSFNSGDSSSVFTGFSLKWYKSLFSDADTMNALKNTVVIALLSATISTVLGTAATVGISKLSKWKKTTVNMVTNIPMMNPDIVTGVSMLLLFVFVGKLIGIKSVLGFWTVLIAHITFNIPYVILSVRPALTKIDKHLTEAACDLGCTSSQAFFKVVFPCIKPGIFTGFITALTLSVDDFVISHFTTGNGFTTLPLHIYTMTKQRVKPDMNALSTLLFVVILVLLIIINIRKDKENKTDK